MERIIDGGVVAVTVPLPGTRDVVVLLDPEQRPDGVMQWHPFHNVLRVGPSGQVVWHADLMRGETAAKCWLGVEFDGALRAWTYSHECVLDPVTGGIVDSTSTK